jgi:hypothetical protein
MNELWLEKKHWYVWTGYPNRLVNILPQWHLDLLESYDKIEKVSIEDFRTRCL